RKVLRDAPWQFSKEGNRQFFRDHMEVENIDMLVALARAGDKDAVEILRKCARDARSAGMKVPPDDLQEFVWEWFIDGPPKAKSGASQKDTEVGYTAIAGWGQMVRGNYGSRKYSTSEHRGNQTAQMSGCGLVGEE